MVIRNKKNYIVKIIYNLTLNTHSLLWYVFSKTFYEILGFINCNNIQMKVLIFHHYKISVNQKDNIKYSI